MKRLILGLLIFMLSACNKSEDLILPSSISCDSVDLVYDASGSITGWVGDLTDNCREY